MTIIASETSYVMLDNDHYLYVTVEFMTRKVFIMATGKLRVFGVTIANLLDKWNIILFPNEKEKLLLHFAIDREIQSFISLTGEATDICKLPPVIARTLIFDLKDSILTCNETVISYSFNFRQSISKAVLYQVLDDITPTPNLLGRAVVYFNSENVTFTNGDESRSFSLTNYPTEAKDLFSYLVNDEEWEISHPITVEFIKIYPTVTVSITSNSLLSRLRVWVTNLSLRWTGKYGKEIRTLFFKDSSISLL